MESHFCIFIVKLKVFWGIFSVYLFSLYNPGPINPADFASNQQAEIGSYKPKVGAIRNKSVDLSNSDTLLVGKSIGKAIVSLQIPEVLSDEAIQVLL